MTSTARISLLSKEEALQRGRELGISDYIAQMNIFRMLLNHPKLAGELNSTIISLVSGDKAVSDRCREIIIMRVSWKAYCDYEWSQNWFPYVTGNKLNVSMQMKKRCWLQPMNCWITAKYLNLCGSN